MEKINVQNYVETIQEYTIKVWRFHVCSLKIIIFSMDPSVQL